MPSITRMQQIEHDDLKGTVLYSLSEVTRTGMPQEVVVSVEPNGQIESHTHTVDAEMFIVAGAGEVVSADPELNGASVGPGDRVYFEKNVSHGFRASAKGLVFVSRNGGIVDEQNSWDISFDCE